jgi:hypothetical protein
MYFCGIWTKETPLARFVFSLASIHYVSREIRAMILQKDPFFRKPFIWMGPNWLAGFHSLS